jgi:hypothetical protein
MVGVPEDGATIRSFYEVLINNSMRWAKSGWGGYASPGGMEYLNPLPISDEAAAADMNEIRNFATSINATVIETVLPSFATWYADFISTASFQASGTLLSLGSRLLPTKNFETDASRRQLLDSILAAQEGHAIAFFFAVAPFLHNPDGMTSVTPAWRDSLAIVRLCH